MIAEESELNRIILGVLALSGKLRFTLSSLSRISFTASSRFVPYSNSNWTEEEPSFEFEVIFLRPLTLITALSIGFVIVFSTDSGPAFGYEVEIIKKGFSVSGIRAIATFPNVKIPSIPNKANTIKTNTGWSNVFLLKLIFIPS